MGASDKDPTMNGAGGSGSIRKSGTGVCCSPPCIASANPTTTEKSRATSSEKFVDVARKAIPVIDNIEG